jgi:hypothetical protein
VFGRCFGGTRALPVFFPSYLHQYIRRTAATLADQSLNAIVIVFSKQRLIISLRIVKIFTQSSPAKKRKLQLPAKLT